MVLFRPKQKIRFKYSQLYPLLCLILVLTSCQSKNEITHSQIVAEYISTYQKRADFEKFLSFYDKDIILRDMISGEKKEGIEDLKNFFDWNNAKFNLLDTLTFQVETIVIENNNVVIQGYFTPFMWEEARFEAMQFQTMLKFNNDNKIISQIDWINYPSELLDYQNRKNSNAWIE